MKEIVLEDLEILNIPDYVSFPDENDVNWKPVTIPFINKLSSSYFINTRGCWIRGKFSVDYYERKHYYAIDLGLVSTNEIVYINNQLVGDYFFDALLLHEWLRPRSHIFPADFILKETNEVYIHLITDRKYITQLTSIRIQNKPAYARSQRWYNLLFGQLPVGLSILLIGIFIVLLRNFFYFGNKRHLLYAIFALNIFIPIFFTFSIFNFTNPRILTTIASILFTINTLFIIFLIQSFYKIYLFKHNIIWASALLIFSIYEIIKYFYPIRFINSIQGVKFILIFISSVPYCIYLIHYLKSIKPDRFLYKFSVTLFILFNFFFIIERLEVVFNIWFQYYYHIFTTPVYAALIIFYETKEAKKSKSEFNRIYQMLENRKKNNHTLSESAEQKIERVISFINENYTSDISREGLASAVDMNRDYMSRLFYKHTGKKINEYLNHLRINNAAERLKESNNGKRIMDVAFAVGFESLSTFNRLFKDITGLAPTEYRKKNE